MDKIKQAVEEAVREYNHTMLGRNKEALARGSYEEKRGIFYNCLRRNISANLNKFQFIEKIPVDRVQCKLREDNTLESFQIDDYKYSYGFTEEAKEMIADIRSLNNVFFLDTEVYINLDSIREFKFTF